MTITIYHNPDCGTSRNTLAMIRQSGEEPEVIEYLKTPPSRARLVELIAAMGITPRQLLREKGTPYAELGLGGAKWTDDALIDFMMAHSHLDQPADRHHASWHEAVPTLRGRVGYPAQSRHRPVHQG